MSVIGAFDNSGKTLYYVEDNLKDFEMRYLTGKYDIILEQRPEGK